MKIVVLDGYTLNPGDLSWSELESLGEVKIYDRTSRDEILERSINVEIFLLLITIYLLVMEFERRFTLSNWSRLISLLSFIVSVTPFFIKKKTEQN